MELTRSNFLRFPKALPPGRQHAGLRYRKAGAIGTPKAEWPTPPSRRAPRGIQRVAPRPERTEVMPPGPAPVLRAPWPVSRPA
jgi:hypothetical protein